MDLFAMREFDGHERVVFANDEATGLRSVIAIHSTALGPAAGGCRMWPYATTTEAVTDVLRLSRGMSYKNAMAGLPFGGGKAVIIGDSRKAKTGELFQAYGRFVGSLGGSYITAEDVGTSSRDMAVIAQETEHVAGLARSRGGSGDPSPFTALGVEAAIRATCRRAFGDGSLRERSLCILGLGHVGSRIAKRCARAGARLIVADVDPGKRALAQQLGATWSTPAEAWRAEVDVLVPCALGGLFDDEVVPRLRCRAIAGAANNQLADDRIAGLLQQHGILWAPDFVANAGGIINIAEEAGGYDPAAARHRVRGIGTTIEAIFDRSAQTGETPLAAAMELARRRLNGAVS